MKFRTQLFVAIGLLVLLLGIALFTFSPRIQEPAQVFPATVNRDCAPWDGGAFMVSIPYDSGSVINISIWKSPDIQFPITFSFPGQSGSIGNAIYQPSFGPPEELTGKVSFQHVEQENPVEGEFHLVTEAGRQFKGKFKAEWIYQPVYCG